MSTHNHTAIASGAAANAATINTPLGTLDAAIGNLAALTTTAKTSAVAAINEVDANADAAAAAVGTLAILTTTAKTSAVAAINEVDANADNLFDANRHGTLYYVSSVDWAPSTRSLVLTNIYLIHGKSGKYLTMPGANTISFASTGDYGYAYLSGVDRNSVQASYSSSNLHVEAFNALSHDLADPDIVILATYTHQTLRIWSPFLEQRMHLDYVYNQLTSHDVVFEARNGLAWNPNTKILTITTGYIYHLKSGKYTNLGVVTLNFSAITTFGIAYVFGVTRDTPQTLGAGSIAVQEFNALTADLNRPDVYVLATYAPGPNQVWTPFDAPRQHTAALTDTLTTNARWRNNYPQIYSKLPKFTQKLLAPAADVRIILWGDSLFARDEHTSATGLDVTALPPMLLSKNIAWYIWQNLPMHKAAYRRFDYTGFFTEVGSWATATGDAAWDDNTTRTATTRLSAPSPGAAGSFAWTLDTADDSSGCNLIYRTTANGDNAATITVTQGAGYLERWTGAAWAEAHGATLSFLETDDGARYGNTVYQKRLRLRKAVGHQNDSVTVTVARATADTDWLAYWGVELYDAKNSRYIVQLINSARGSHTLNQSGTSQLYTYMQDDVIGHDPDLVVLEIPLLNMMQAPGATVADIVNSVHDVVWGDRPGSTNSWSLKAQSNDWADFEVLLVIPHHYRAAFTAGGAWAEVLTDTTARDIYNAVKALIYSQGDVGMIDISTAMMRQADASRLYAGQYYTAMTGTGLTGSSYTNDNTHQNDTGTLIWARELCPVFDLNAL